MSRPAARNRRGAEVALEAGRIARLAEGGLPRAPATRGPRQGSGAHITSGSEVVEIRTALHGLRRFSAASPPIVGRLIAGR
jgi:hypothetical protein